MTDETYVTKAELDTFKDALFSELERRFESFTEDFIEALNADSEKGDEECSCENQMLDPDQVPRYVINAGGHTYRADAIGPNPLYGIDYYLCEEIEGKQYNQKGTIMSSDVSIIDLRPEYDLEFFENMKKATIDRVIENATEARIKEETIKKTQNSEVNSNYISYN